MTVSSSTNKVSFNGDGSTTVFAYSFKVFDESDLTVILRASDGTETTQTITTNYTVSGVGDAGGGNVTMVTAPASGEQLTILREQPLTQGLDLVPNDPFPANSIEDSLDKLTFMVQQQQEELDRSIKASKTTTISTVEFVESAATRANKVFAFDGSGDLDLTQEIGTFQGDWAASTAYAVRDIVKDTNNNNIYIANTAHTSSGTVPLSGNADIAKWDLLVDAAAATTSANNAATSATAAATSATAAATSATAAATSESNAATSASNASTSETNAAASATNAATSESNAAGSESAAATSESNAATSATNASTSASAAATSATNAATSETAAAASQAAAATSETNAATSATSAATNATNAATSASNASTAQTAAETAQTAAEAAQAAAELAADNFDDTYLGSKSSDPTVDNDGGALNAGDLYFNTTSNTLKVYSGSAWQDAAVDSSGFVQTTGDTMTGDLDIQGTLTSDGLTVDGASSIRHSDATTNISLTPTSTGGVVNVRDSSGNSQIVLDARTTQVGIGATSPTANLDIKRTSGDNDDIIRIGTTDNYYLGISRSNTTGAFSFQGNQTGFNDIILAPTSGNVGIGTSSPSAKLDLQGTAAGDEMLEITHSGASQPWKFTSGESGVTNESLRISRGASGEWMRFHAGLGTVFYHDGSERMRIDSSGNVGIGVVPTTDHNPVVEALQVGSTANLYGRNDAETITLTSNSYLSLAGYPKYITTNEASEYTQSSGNHIWYNAPSGTAGTSCTQTERMRIDSSGNVGIGTVSPSETLDVSGNIRALGANSRVMFGPDGFEAGIKYATDATLQIASRTGESIAFTNGHDGTERMRIDSSGNVLVGTTSSLTTSSASGLEIRSNGQLKVGGSAAVDNVVLSTGTTGTKYFISHYQNGTYVGAIIGSGTGLSLSSASDYRLKENVSAMTGATERLKQLNPSRFNFVSAPDTTVDGFLAHEVQTVVPEAVVGTKDAVNADGNPVYQGIDQSKLVPLLTAALQEAVAKIETLETEMTSVKARLDALEA